MQNTLHNFPTFGFSISNNPRPRVDAPAVDGYRGVIGDFTEIVRYDHTPAILRNGYAKSENYLGSYYLFGDVDNGFPIKNFCQLCGQYAFIILTSRSHQKLKHGLIQDHYHVFFPRQNPYISLAECQNDLRALIAQYPFFDASCKDPARRFLANPNAICIRNRGIEFHPEPLPIEPPPMTRNTAILRDLPWIIDGVRKGGNVDGRQNFCFRVARWASREGHDLDAIETALLDTPEGADLFAEDPREFRHAIRNIRERQPKTPAEQVDEINEFLRTNA